MKYALTVQAIIQDAVQLAALITISVILMLHLLQQHLVLLGMDIVATLQEALNASLTILW